MLLDLVSLAVVFFAAFGITYVVTPFLAYRMKKRGFVGRDMNKPGKPEVPEMGGIAVLLGFVFGTMVVLFYYSYLHAFPALELLALLAGVLTVFIIGFLGVIDDLIGWRDGIRQWQHALVPAFAALPLMALNVGQSNIVVPLFGLVNIGILYSLVLVPIGITGAANATNMLEGLNGLGTGLGIINTTAILLIAYMLEGRIEVIVLGVILLAVLLAFYRYNRFPAKIFPGDSLTLMVGAGLATLVIIGDMERVGILLFIPFFIEFAIKAKHKFQSQCFGTPRRDGTLAPDPRGGSLTQFVMRRGKFTETQVVYIILGMQALLALFTILLVANKLL